MADPRIRQDSRLKIDRPPGPPGERRRAFLLLVPLLALMAAFVLVYAVNCSETDAGGLCTRYPTFPSLSALLTAETSPAPSPKLEAVEAPTPATPAPPPASAPQKTEVGGLFASVQDRIRTSLVAGLQPDPEAVGMVATVRSRRGVSPDLVKDAVEVLKKIGFEVWQDGGELDAAGGSGGSTGDIYVRSAPQRRHLAVLIVEGLARVSPSVLKGEVRVGTRPLAGAVPQSNGRYDPIIVDMF